MSSAIRPCGLATLSRPMKGCWHLPADRRKAGRSRRSIRQRYRPTSSPDRPRRGFLLRALTRPPRTRAARSCKERTACCRAHRRLDADRPRRLPLAGSSAASHMICHVSSVQRGAPVASEMAAARFAEIRGWAMNLNALGYVGIRTRNLEDWAAYGTRFLGMQLVDKSRGTLALRMDDRKQRIVVHTDENEG